MKPILVHLHLYYLDQWDFIKSHLENINVPYLFFITMVEKNVEIEQQVLAFNPNAKITLVENIGYDVYPFIDLLNKLNLDDYSYIIKLHTKRFMPTTLRINRYSMFGYNWRNYLYSFIASQKNFNRCLKAFETNPKLGIVGDFRVIRRDPEKYKIISSRVRLLLEQYCLGGKVVHISGTIFMARADLFKFIQNMKLQKEDFPTLLVSGDGATLSHVMEVFFGSFIYNMGYEIDDVSTTIYKKMWINFIQIAKSLSRLFVEFTFLEGNKLQVRIFRKKIGIFQLKTLLL